MLAGLRKRHDSRRPGARFAYRVLRAKEAVRRARLDMRTETRWGCASSPGALQCRVSLGPPGHAETFPPLPDVRFLFPEYEWIDSIVSNRVSRTAPTIVGMTDVTFPVYGSYRFA